MKQICELNDKIILPGLDEKITKIKPETTYENSRFDIYLETENKKAFWFCKCSCGGSIVVDTQSLKRGNTSSCGCLISKGEDMVRNILNEKGHQSAIFRQ